MRVLHVASECAPFVKTGGLADVVAALPKATAAEGVEARVLLPAYPPLAAIAAAGSAVARIASPFGELGVVAATAGGLDLLLVVAPWLYDRPGNIYLGGWPWEDNARRFGALSFAAAALGQGAGAFRPDVLHLHDWQAGLAPAYLRAAGGERPGIVTTIHNVAFQGTFAKEMMGELGLPWTLFTAAGGIEFHDQLAFLKAGIVYADKITTVSPTYARELMGPEFGMGFEGILAGRRGDFVGILNGVEEDVWDPREDPALVANFDAKKPKRRRGNRPALLARFGLALADDAPLFIVVSRLTWQKGIDLLVEALPRLLARGAGLAVLGSGDATIEDGLARAAAEHPGRVGFSKAYDEPLSHLMQGGGDVILVPSRFEPCGLTQLYGLRYGCLPLVARTGGLADTVIDANEAALGAGVATGFQFSPVTSAALGDAILRACDLFANRPLWKAMIASAMRQPVGWGRSAAAYAALYEQAARKGR